LSCGAGILLLAAALVAPAAAATPAAPPTAVLVLFLDAESDAALPAPPAELRERAGQALVAALAAPGRRLCAGEEVESLLAAARVRSHRGLSQAVVTELCARCDAGQLIVARLACGQGKLFLSLRGLAPADGCLQQVAVAERDLAIGGDWRRAVGDAALELAAGWREPGPAAAGASVLVLPARGPSVDPLLLSLLEESLLGELLAQGRWRIPEPALLLSALRQVGVHAASLGAAKRRALAADLGAEVLLRLTVSEYEEGPGGGGATGSAEAASAGLDDEASRGGEPAREGASPGARQAGRPLYATLESVDADSGLLRLVAEQFLPAQSPSGSFGRPRRLPWIARGTSLTAPLVAAFAAQSAAGAHP
jgi:hypothetical protein